ncbi:MAG: alpha/beta hydrolase family protein [Bacteroidales bacterium]
MIKRSLTLTVLLLALQGGVNLFAQNDFKVLPWKAPSSLNTFLIQTVHEQYRVRDSLLKIATSSYDNMEKYRINCKKKYIDILGSLPPRTNLNTKIVSSFSADNFKVEKIVFETLPNHHVTSNLYIPNGKGPFPGILFFCGHEATAKATESYQSTAQLFAKNGFVVLMIDPISQGERYQLVDSIGQPSTRGGTTEHTLLNAGSNLIGTSVAAYELWDNVRSLDYLESRPEVDKTKLGCLGNSGGGTQTTYFIAFDDRIKVAAPCSYVAVRERNLELTGASDGCQHIPFEGRENLEISDFLIAFAPKPLLILAGKFDFVDYNGVKMVNDEMQSVYSLYNADDKFKVFTYDDGHGISKPKREVAVAWFRKWLYKDDGRIEEKGITPFKPEELNCTQAESVNAEYRNEQNIQDFNLAMAQKLSKERNTFGLQSIETRKTKILELLGITTIAYTPEIETIEKTYTASYTLEKTILRVKNQIPVPTLVFLPNGNSPIQGITIWLNESGKSKIAADSTVIAQLISNGTVVIAPDLSGVGESTDNSTQNEPKYWNKEYRNAMIALHTGTTLSGIRVNELIAIVQYINSNPELKSKPISVKANGLYAPVALFAAFLNESIESIEISDAINSYIDLVKNPLTKDAYTYVIPSILKYCDIPDLIRWIEPRKVIITNNKLQPCTKE